MTFETPEAAARGDTPERYALVLGCQRSPDDEHAFVLLGMNGPPDPYPYLVFCHHADDGWSEGCGGNGNMWCPTGPGDLGGYGVWDEADTEHDSVRARLGSVEVVVPVVWGYFLLAVWDIPVEAAAQGAVVIDR